MLVLPNHYEGTERSKATIVSLNIALTAYMYSSVVNRAGVLLLSVTESKKVLRVILLRLLSLFA